MAINRFYSPQRSQYVSQFVPTQLPTDLMIKALGTKQAQEDKKQEFIAKSNEFDFNYRRTAAEDKKRHDEIISEIRQKGDELSTIDITKDPQAFMQYKNFMRGIQDNQEIKAIQGYYEKGLAYDEARKKILADPKKALQGEALFKSDMQWKEYDTGLGYKGEYQDLDVAREAFDMDPVFRDSYGALKDSGGFRETLQGLFKTGQGWTGVNEDIIDETTFRHLQAWREGAVGKAAEDLVDMQYGLSYSAKKRQLSTEEGRKEYETAVQNKILERANAVGKDYVRGVSKNTISDRPGHIANQLKEQEAAVFATGLATKGTQDGGELIEAYDTAVNSINTTTKSISEFTGIEVPNFITKDFQIDQKAVNEYRQQVNAKIKELADTKSGDANALRDQLSQLEEDIHRAKVVSDKHNYGRHRARAVSDAVKSVSEKLDIPEENLKKYLNQKGEFDPQPLVAKITKAAGTRMVGEFSNSQFIMNSLSAAFGRDFDYTPDQEATLAAFVESLDPNTAEGQRNIDHLYASGISRDELQMFRKIFVGDKSPLIFGIVEKGGLSIIKEEFTKKQKEWDKNFKYNVGQESPQDREDYAIETDSSRRLKKHVDEGKQLLVKTDSGKIVDLAKAGLGEYSLLFNYAIRDSKNNPTLTVQITADKDGKYVNPITGEESTGNAAGEVIKFNLEAAGEDVIKAAFEGSRQDLENAAYTTTNATERMQFQSQLQIDDAYNRGASGGAKNLVNAVEGLNLQTNRLTSLPGVALNVAPGYIVHDNNIQVKKVKLYTGEPSFEIYYKGQKVRENITGTNMNLAVEVEKFIQKKEVELMNTKGANLK